MSLINDALKRAKQAQQDNPPTMPQLEFRPVETGQNPQRRPTWFVVGLSLMTVAVLGMAGALVWFVSRSKPATLTVAARVAELPLPPRPQITATQMPAQPTVPTVAKPASPLVKSVVEPDANSLPEIAPVPEAAPPAPLKLQGIFFNPQSPSVVVNGKTLYLGDRVNGFRLRAVSPVSATFANANATNVLSLSDP